MSEGEKSLSAGETGEIDPLGTQIRAAEHIVTACVLNHII